MPTDDGKWPDDVAVPAGCTLLQNALIIAEAAKIEEMLTLAERLAQSNANVAWFLGDSILWLQRHGYTGVCKALAGGRWTEKRLQSARTVALRFRPENRKPGVAFGHHRLIADTHSRYPKTTERDFERLCSDWESGAARWLTMTGAAGLSVDELDDCIVEEQKGWGMVICKKFAGLKPACTKLSAALAKTGTLEETPKLSAALTFFRAQIAAIDEQIERALPSASEPESAEPAPVSETGTPPVVEEGQTPAVAALNEYDRAGAFCASALRILHNRRGWIAVTAAAVMGLSATITAAMTPATAHFTSAPTTILFVRRLESWNAPNWIELDLTHEPIENAPKNAKIGGGARKPEVDRSRPK